MACAKCGPKKTTMTIVIGEDWQARWNSGDFTVALYNGPDYNKLVASPTGAILSYGFTTYGRHNNGALLVVHKDDVAHESGIFIEIDIDDERYAATLLYFNIEPGFIPEPEPESVQTRDVLPEAVKPRDTIDLTSFVDAEISTTTEDGLPLLTREEAMPLTEFAKTYGYSHHLSVMPDIRSGLLLSYKDGKQTYIYHKEK